MAKDRLKVPKAMKEPPKPKKGATGPVWSLLFGIVIGVALVWGFLAVRNSGALDEWIEEYPALEFLDDGPLAPSK